MKKKVLFFGKLFIVTLLLFVFCFGVVMPQYTGNYQASMVDKAARLRSVEGPKIVLIGNSNLAFGMDSQMLEEAFSMPVVIWDCMAVSGMCLTNRQQGLM